MISIVKFIASKISVGSFTNKDAWREQPFARLDKGILIDHKCVLMERMISSGVDDDIIHLFDKAFDFFIKHPEKYDGASGDVELHKVGDYFYDISGILHDWLDAINYTYTKTDLYNADKLLARVMEQLGDATVHYDKRVGLLFLIMPVRFLLSRQRRELNYVPDSDIFFTIEQYVNDYSINYWPFFKYVGIGILLLIVIITHQAFPWLYKAMSVFL
jgi:hypothetical protein